MRIALLGGTGDIGQGLALRWLRDSDHEVVIGSRDPDKARATAEEYETALASVGGEGKVTGFENAMAADRGDVVVCAVPAYHLADTIDTVGDRLDPGTPLVSPAVGMNRDGEGLHYNPPPAGSVAAMAADAAPEDVPVVGAFHNLPAGGLADLGREVDWDTVVVADDSDAKDTVMRLAGAIEGLRPLDGGGLGNAGEVEAITPLLVNLAAENRDLHDLGVKFH